MVSHFSIFHSVHFEEIEFHLIRKAIISMIATLKLVESIPTYEEFDAIWTTEVSIVCVINKKHVRKIKSLRSTVLGLFHDRRGKIANVARTIWRSVLTPPPVDARSKQSSRPSGVHSLTDSSSDCWSFIHKRDSGLVNIRVVQRGERLSGPNDSDPALPESELQDSHPEPGESTDEPDVGLWHVSVQTMTADEYKSKFAGATATAIEDEPPYGDVEWTVHPASMFIFAKVLSSACVAKCPGLKVDLKVGGKSQRIMSVTTNASPKLENFILSLAS
jgi:hypothetical protein